MHGSEIVAVARVRAPTGDEFQRLVEHCLACARACLRCADECLGSVEVERLNRCLQLSLHAADRCFAVAAGGPALLDCAVACERAADECRPYIRRYESCRVCLEECERCSAVCRGAARA